MQTVTPPNLNDQHTWGGHAFCPPSATSPTVDNGLDQATIIAHGRHDTQAQPLSQAGVIASSSNNLFHPVPNIPSSSAFTLPPVPSNPPYHAYNPPDTFQRPLPYRSSLSSYNNPHFQIPSSHTQAPLGPPPLFPPRIRSCPVFHSSQHQFNHSSPCQFNQPQNTYIHPQPAYIHPQPAYNHSQPAYNHSQPPIYNFPFVPPVNVSPAQLLHQITPLPVILPPSPPSPTVSTSKNLPTVTHIPILTSKNDFFAWDEGVNSLIRANNLLGHILDPSVYVDPSRPDLAPTPPPVLTMTSLAQDIVASNQWWADDNIVQHILLSRLGAVPRGLLPASNIVTHTALSIYKLLLQYYGTSNFADCTELLSSLHNSTCSTGCGNTS